MLTLDGPFKLIPALYYSVCSVSDVGQLLQCTMGDEDRSRMCSQWANFWLLSSLLWWD